MATGTRYLFPPVVYPRYKYFLDRLLRLVPRFERTIDAVSLSMSISDGEERLKQILENSECVQEQISVTVFSNGNVSSEVLQKIGEDLGVQSIDPTDHKTVKTESVEWSVLEGVEISRYCPQVGVYVHNGEEIENEKSKLLALSEVQQSNCIIYDAKTSNNCLFTELSEFQQGKQAFSDLSLCKRIQHLLEAKVVEVVETISIYIRECIPKKGQKTDKSLLDSINSLVKQCLRNWYTIHDILPRNIAKILHSSAVSEQMQHESAMEHESQMECDSPMEHDSAHGASPSKRAKTSLPPFTQTKDGRRIYNTFIEYLARRTKCHICDHASSTYGLSGSLINSFLGEKCFGYEAKFCKRLQDASFDRWLKLEPKNGVEIAVFFSAECLANMPDLLQDTENYIKTKFAVFTILQKMQFEVNGLLRRTKVQLKATGDTKPPAPLELPKVLQNDLVNIEEVYGCGTLYGKLTIHVKSDPTLPVKEEISQILQKHKYRYGYNVERVDTKNEHAGGYGLYEIGSNIRTKFTAAEKMKLQLTSNSVIIGDYKHGSLGCYVMVYQKSDSASGKTKGELFGITCAHVVADCGNPVDLNNSENTVEAQKGPTFCELGISHGNFVVYDGQRMDVAAIKIFPERVIDCDKRLKKSCGLYSQCTSLYEGDIKSLDGSPVFKIGPVTNITQGIVCSRDYRVECIRQSNSSNYNFSEDCNILMEVEPGSPPDQAFSKKGDSGSVICLTNEDDGYTLALSVLQGETVRTDATTNEKIRFTYSCHLKQSLQELGDKAGCEIELNCDAQSKMSDFDHEP